jgi:AraC-like DNA-binding protein
MDIVERQPAPRQHDDARLWRVEAFGGLELLRARFAAFSFAPHAHAEFMIVVTERGTARPRFWGAEQRIGPGDLFVLNPGEVHGGGPASGAMWCYRSFYPPAALLRRVVRELARGERGTPAFVEEVIHDPMVTGMLRRAHLALERPGAALAGESLLIEALASLVARYATDVVPVRRAGREHRAVTRAKEYLEALPGENVTLDALAQAAGIGPFHLCRVFRSETGLSPHAYQILVRVRRAKVLLARGLPIARAATDAGFADQAHLTRHFKRTFGVTPGRYLAELVSFGGR